MADGPGRVYTHRHVATCIHSSPFVLLPVSLMFGDLSLLVHVIKPVWFTCVTVVFLSGGAVTNFPSPETEHALAGLGWGTPVPRAPWKACSSQATGDVTEHES